jgi:hypothetical protein
MSKLTEAITLQTVIRAKVLKMLGISELEYGDFLMRQAFGYLEEQLGNNIMCKSLSESSMFWGWWRCQWHNIDMLFVEEAKQMSESERWEYYKIVHAVESFDFIAPKSVLKDAFSKLSYQPRIVHHL